MEDRELERENRKLEITFTIQTAYYAHKFLQEQPLDLLVQKALDLYLDSDLTIEEIRRAIQEKINDMLGDYNKRYDLENVTKNHEVIYSRLEQLVIGLEAAGVDYQLAGALCGYLKYGKESDRCHDDIDINVNEKDIGKLKKVCEGMGLSFHDNRLTSPRVLEGGIPRGEHEVIAQDPDSDFHIGAFPFERLADGTIITKGYYHSEGDIPCCREEIIGSNLAKEFFGKEKIDFKGHPLYITSPEYVYMLKEYTDSGKDRHDRDFLKNKIDKDKLNRIKELSKTETATQCVQVMTLPPVVDSKDKKSLKVDELNDMFTEEENDNSIEKNETNEKAKSFLKKSSNNIPGNNNQGSGTALSFTILILAMIAIGLIGLIIYTIID